MNATAWDILMRASGYSALEPDLARRILEGIRVGVPIDFTGDRAKSRHCDNLRITAVDEPKVNAVIEADVASGKKAGPFDEPPFLFFSCSPIGAVPKRGSAKIRVIHHLSFPRGGDSINGATTDEYCPLGTFDRAMEFIRELGPGCWLIKLDVEAAYKQIPVRPEDWPLLGFKWRGKYYYERVLPFGLKSSCRLWELYATALQHFFEQSLGITCVVHYIDDFLFVVKDVKLASDQLRRALGLCVRLGLPMAKDKTEGPTTQLTFLGIEIDTVAMEARLPEEKLLRLHSLLDEWIGRARATVTEMQSLEGVLQWCVKVVRPGRSFLHRIRKFCYGARERGEGPHTITDDVRADIGWWIRFARSWNGVSVLYEREWQEAVKLVLHTDASEWGYGARCGNQWIRGAWSQAQKNRATNTHPLDYTRTTRSMPFLELLALVLAAATWGHLWRGKRIRFVTDCLPVRDNVRRRESPVARNMELLRHLATLAASHQFDFDCEWIAGATNVSADLLSRQDSLQEFLTTFPEADRVGTRAPSLPPFEEM